MTGLYDKTATAPGPGHNQPDHDASLPGSEKWDRWAKKRVFVQGSYDNANDTGSSTLGNIGADLRWRLEFE